MRHRKFLHFIIPIIFILILLTGCGGTTTPTSTVEPPTETVTAAPPTPIIEAEPGAPGLGDSLYPGFGNGGYDVQHYTLDLKVNDAVQVSLRPVAGMPMNSPWWVPVLRTRTTTLSPLAITSSTCMRMSGNAARRIRAVVP